MNIQCIVFLVTENLLCFLLFQAYSLMSKYKRGITENSGKFVLLFNILEEAIAIGDKILVFRFVSYFEYVENAIDIQ